VNFTRGLVVVLAACQEPRVGADAVAPGQHRGPVTGVAFLAGEVVSCSQAGLAWSRHGPIAPAPFRAFALAPLHAARAIFLAGGAPARSGDVAIVARDGVRARRTIATDCAYAVAIAPDEKTAAVGCADGRVLLLSLPRLDTTRTLHDHAQPCRGVAFAPDGQSLASAGLDGVVILRDLHADTMLRLADHTAGVEALAFSTDGARLASGARDGKVRVHARDGRLLRTFGRLGAAVQALCWRDEHTIAAGLADGRVLALHEGGDGERSEIARLPTPVFSVTTAGAQLAAGGDGILAPIP
jgi:hypothetical protein